MAMPTPPANPTRLTPADRAGPAPAEQDTPPAADRAAPSPANPVPGDAAPGDAAPGDPAPKDPAPKDPAPKDPASGDLAPPDAAGPPAPADPHQSRPATEAEARALASALRLRILRLCLGRALTNKEIALRLGLNPATTLHHVRTLVATGFLAAQPERRGSRGAREVPYRATGKSWRVDVSETGVRGGHTAMIEAFRAEIGLLDVEGPEIGLARLGLRLTAPELRDLRYRLDAILEEYAALPADRDGRPVSVFLAIYPDASRQ